MIQDGADDRIARPLRAAAAADRRGGDHPAVAPQPHADAGARSGAAARDAGGLAAHHRRSGEAQGVSAEVVDDRGAAAGGGNGMSICIRCTASSNEDPMTMNCEDRSRCASWHAWSLMRSAAASGRLPRARRRLSVAADHHHGAVSAGRQLRHRDAARGQQGRRERPSGRSSSRTGRARPATSPRWRSRTRRPTATC